MSRFILVNRYFHPDESATSQFATDLARHLAARREVLVLTSRQLLEQPEARLPARGGMGMPPYEVRIHRLWSTARGRNWLPGRLLDYVSFLAAVGLWLLFWARRGDTVLSKTDPPLLGVVTTFATLGRGVRRVQWLQDLFPEAAVGLGFLGGRSWTVRCLSSLGRVSLRRSHLVVVNSAGMLARLRDQVGGARLVHIPNWAEDHVSAKDCRPTELVVGRHSDAAALSVGRHSDAAIVVGYSGNLGRAHPIEGLLQIAESCDDPAIQFLFTGGGANHQRLRERVRQLGRSNWSFLPYQPREQLGALLRRADLHFVILDPRVEGFMFPSKVFGILSAGRPILHLGDASGEVAQLLREHDCGWSLPADGGAQILSLLQQRQVRQRRHSVPPHCRHARHRGAGMCTSHCVAAPIHRATRRAPQAGL